MSTARDQHHPADMICPLHGAHRQLVSDQGHGCTQSPLGLRRAPRGPPRHQAPFEEEGQRAATGQVQNSPLATQAAKRAQHGLGEEQDGRPSGGRAEYGGGQSQH